MAPPDGLKPNMSTAIPRTARAVNLSTIACENDSAGHIFTGDGDTPAQIADVEPDAPVRWAIQRPWDHRRHTNPVRIA